MITVEFIDFNDMMTFARQLAGMETVIQTEKTEIPADPKAAVAPPQHVVPVTPAPPQAVIPAAPVPTAPMPPQAAVPVQTPTVSMPAPVAPAPAPVPVPAVPTSTVSYTQDDLARAAMTLMDAGRQGELQALLAQFGVATLPNLAPEHYGAFATALRGMGAQI